MNSASRPFARARPIVPFSADVESSASRLLIGARVSTGTVEPLKHSDRASPVRSLSSPRPSNTLDESMHGGRCLLLSEYVTLSASEGTVDSTFAALSQPAGSPDPSPEPHPVQNRAAASKAIWRGLSIYLQR